MSRKTVNGKLVINSVVTLSPLVVDCTFTDAEGYFNATNIAVEHRVFFSVEAQQVERYKISALANVSNPTIRLTLVRDDAGTASTLTTNNLAGKTCYLSGASDVGLMSWSHSAVVQGVPEALVAFARNYDIWEVIDPTLGGGSGNPQNSDAAGIGYSNTASGLAASNVQSAVDELALKNLKFTVDTFTAAASGTPAQGYVLSDNAAFIFAVYLGGVEQHDEYSYNDATKTVTLTEAVLNSQKIKIVHAREVTS